MHVVVMLYFPKQLFWNAHEAFSSSLFVGGYDGQDFLSSVECYDPMSDTWQVVTNMCSGRSGAGVAVGMEPCKTGMCSSSAANSNR